MNKIKRRLIYLSVLLYIATILYYLILKKIIFNQKIRISKQLIIYPLIFFTFLCIFLQITFQTYHNIFNFLYLIFYLIFALYVNLFFPFSILFFCYLIKINLPFKISIFLFPIIGIIITIYGIYNSYQINIERIKINCPELKKKQLIICHLTDLHLGAINGKKLVKKIVTKIEKEENLDLIVITGDIVDGTSPLEENTFSSFKNIKIPIYYIYGNREKYSFYNETKILLNKTNFIHLNNKNINFKNLINLIGIDYDNSNNKITNLINQIIIKNNLPNILLYHIPIFEPLNLKKWNIFLMLSGHTHGGQFFPIHFIMYYKNKLFEGLYNYLNKYYVYCCSGVGTNGPPMRTFSKAKIGIITLENNNY